MKMFRWNPDKLFRRREGGPELLDRAIYCEPMSLRRRGLLAAGVALAAAGATSKSARASYNPNTAGLPQNILNFGADPTGSTDSTTALQTAAATGQDVILPAGSFTISGQVNCTTKGQRFIGSGRNKTFVNILGPSASFVAGIFNVTSGEVGPQFSEMCVNLTQPDTSVRANLNSYPPVFFLNATARCQFENVRIVGGLDGIYMNGNCGGFRAYGCDFGNFSRNVYIDGNLDVTMFTDCQVWPFSATGIMTTNQQSIFNDANTYGVYSLRNDYFWWTGGLFLCGRNAVFGTGATGTSYGGFVNVGFDTYGGLEVSAGNILTDNCVYSVFGGVPNNKNAVLHTGGVVTVRGAKFFVGPNQALNSALVYSNVPSGDAALIVTDCHFETDAIDNRAIFVVPGSSTNLSVVIANNKFDRVGSGTYSQAILEIGGGSGTISGNTCAPNSSATGGGATFLTFDTGVGPYNTSGNMPYNWITTVVGSTVASAGFLSIPAILGQAMPVVLVTGTATIGSMGYAGIGVVSAYQGSIVTLSFGGASPVLSGTFGSAGNFILNGRGTFTPAAGSTLTVQLMSNGNWQEIGRCA